MGTRVIVISIIQAVTTFVLVSGTFLLLGFKPIVALIIGSIGIATAPAATFVIMNRFEITGNMRNVLSGIVVLDDVIEVVIFSIFCQIALLMNGTDSITVSGVILPVAKEFSLAILLGFGIFLIVRFTTARTWLFSQRNGGRRGIRGPEFLSRLITELPGPSVEIFIIV